MCNIKPKDIPIKVKISQSLPEPQHASEDAVEPGNERSNDKTVNPNEANCSMFQSNIFYLLFFLGPLLTLILFIYSTSMSLGTITIAFMFLLLVNAVLWIDFNWSKVYSKTAPYRLKFLEDLLQDSGSFVEFFENLLQDSTHLILCSLHCHHSSHCARQMDQVLRKSV